MPLRQIFILIGLSVVAAVATPLVVHSLKSAQEGAVPVVAEQVENVVSIHSAAPVRASVSPGASGSTSAPASAAGAPKRKATESTDHEDDAFPEWNLKGSGLSTQQLKPWLDGGRVKEIVYFDSNQPQVFKPRGKEPPPKEGFSLMVSSARQVSQYARTRAVELGGRRGSYQGVLGAALPSNAYEAVRFDPGLQNGNDKRVSRPVDLQKSVQGPDYDFEEYISREDAENPQSAPMIRLKSRIVSLGREGTIFLRVAQNGVLLDGDGADFAVFENISRDGGFVVHEYAHVGVAESANAPVAWFPCDPKRGVRSGCAGSVPTDEGGDLFDLADVGKSKIQYIVIRDLGTNAMENNADNDSGFDLDALKLNHAYLQ